MFELVKVAKLKLKRGLLLKSLSSLVLGLCFKNEQRVEDYSKELYLKTLEDLVLLRNIYHIEDCLLMMIAVIITNAHHRNTCFSFLES